MNKKLSPPSILLICNGIILMGLGLYFVFIRPPLLPEDPRYIGTSMEQIQSAIPGLLIWLRRVFWVMGGFMFTTGLLMTYLAFSAFQQMVRGARSVAALAGLTSIGWMATVNFVIDSDFKWLLLAFNIPWIASVILSAKKAETLK
jgi:hypothetical protein